MLLYVALLTHVSRACVLHKTATHAQVQYITGRVRTAAQVNGKSENLNNALRQIYGKKPNGR